MSYKTRKSLSDKNDNFIPQYFDEASDTYKLQPQVATEKMATTIMSIIDKEPPRLKNIRLITSNVYVHWFHDGLFYGAIGLVLYTSADGENWQALHTFATGTAVKIVMVSDTNRLIVAMSNGEVHISGEDGLFSGTPAFTSGTFDERWGHFKCGNIIGINTYEVSGFSAGQKHEAFLSLDNGATFTKIFDNTTFDLILPRVDDSVHLHDMEYDPYSGRLYLWNGDFDNKTLNYSDDFGATWTAAWARGAVNNTTQVIATRYGIALGSDSGPGGVNYVNIDRSKRMNPALTLANYEPKWWYFSEDAKRFVATRRWVDRENEIYLLPFVGEYDEGNYGIIAYSKDGHTWHTLHKTFANGHYYGFYGVTYGNGKIVAMHRDAVNGFKIFVADITL